MKKLFSIVGILLLFACLVGCGNDDKVEEIVLEEARVFVMESGSIDINYSLMPQGLSGVSLSWASSDDNIATVKDGKVSAVSAGEVDITVSSKKWLFCAVSCDCYWL